MSIITFSKTTDKTIINSIFNHPILWKLREGVDTSPPLEPFHPAGREYFVAYLDNVLAGMLGFDYVTNNILTVHINILPPFWGVNAISICEEFKKILKAQSVVTKILVICPKMTKHVRLFALKLGFKKLCVISKGCTYMHQKQDLYMYEWEIN